MEPDFSGYATKAGLKCTDGRTITPDAFKHQDKMQLPLVWAHAHNEPANVLGHVILEHRADGTYSYGFFNNTPGGQTAKALVQHGDLKSLSIYANQLVEKSKIVIHGMIREVSLVLAGANPGALIDNVSMQHDDGEVVELEDTVIIHTGLDIEFEKMPVVKPEVKVEELAHADQTVQDVIDTFTDDQMDVVSYIVGVALENAGNNAEHSGTEGDNKEGTNNMTRNVFEQNAAGGTKAEKHVISHDDMQTIMADFKKTGNTLKSVLEDYALAHGIENLDVLFPDAKTITDRPEFISRRMEWVAGVINGTHHTPFSRIKTIWADITQDEARAKGYIKGHYKKEEWFSLSKRTTSPATIYKKQKLDRDDIIDITDLDIVAWMKAEIRVMFEEELARAILISDGRAVDDEDKVKDPIGATDGVGIRSILNEHELFAGTIYVNIDDTGSSSMEVIEEILRQRRLLKGSGGYTFYTTNQFVVSCLLLKDTLGRRYYNSKEELASALMVSSIVEVEPMEDVTDLVGIIVNLSDYNIGADKGGEVNFFDDFDINYNQFLYLMESRLSGALTRIASAQIVKKTTSTNVLVAPNAPTFVASTGVITIPTQTGVVYKNGASTLSAGAQTALTAGSSMTVTAVPASGYYFANNQDDSWYFKRPAA